MKTLKLRVRYYPGEYAAYAVERKTGWFKWETLTVARISHYSDEETLSPEEYALKSAMDFMNCYVELNRGYITEPYTVAEREYWLDKKCGQWMEVKRDNELDISL